MLFQQGLMERGAAKHTRDSQLVASAKKEHAGLTNTIDNGGILGVTTRLDRQVEHIEDAQGLENVPILRIRRFSVMRRRRHNTQRVPAGGLTGQLCDAIQYHTVCAFILVAPNNHQRPDAASPPKKEKERLMPSYLLPLVSALYLKRTSEWRPKN